MNLRKYLLMSSVALQGTAVLAANVDVQGGGFEAPTIAGKANVANKVAGEIIFDTSDNLFYGWDGTNWLQMAKASILARYSTNAASQNVTNTTTTLIDFEDSEYDTASRVTTGGSWKFTANRAGKYAVDVYLTFASAQTFTISEMMEMYLYKNGSSNTYIARIHPNTTTDTSNAYTPVLQGSTVVSLAANDYIDVRVYQNSGATQTLSASADQNWITVSFVGD